MPGIDNNTHLVLHLNGNSQDASKFARGFSGSGSGFVTSPKVFGSHAVSFNNQQFASMSYPGNTIADLAMFSSTGNTRSLDFWIRFQGLTGSGPVQNIWAENRFTNPPTNHMEIQWTGTAFRVEGIGSGGSASHSTPNLVTAGIITTGVFYHVLLIRINNVVAFYVDGQQVSYGTIGTCHYIGAGQLFIGWSNYNPQRVLNAYLDEIRVYHGNYFGVNPQSDLSDSFIIPAEEYSGTPLKPENLMATAVAFDQIDLEWSEPSSLPVNPINGYKIERREGEDGIWETIDSDTGPFVDAFTVMLMHMRGNDGSNVFLDSAPIAKIPFANGNVQIDTAISKFGGSAALFDGSGDYISFSDSPDYNFGTGDFSIDFQMNPTDKSTKRGIFGQFVDVNNFWGMYFFDDGQVYFTFMVGGVQRASYSFSNSLINTGTWQHIEIVRNGTNFYIFINGVAATLTTYDAISTNDTGDNAGVFRIGSLPYTGFGDYAGSIDEFRISKGIARHTSDFTPPSEEYGIPVLEYSDTGLEQNTLYYYRVTGLNSSGTGQVSDLAYDFTFRAVPTEPLNLSVSPAGGGAKFLQWEPPADEGGSALDEYLIQRKTNDGAFVTIAEDSLDTDYTDSDVLPTNQYNYRVIAVNSFGESRPSNTVRTKEVAGIDDDTVLLLKFDELPFVDVSKQEQGAPSNGAVTLDTTNKVFGEGSGAWDGVPTAGGSILTYGNDPDWDIFDDNSDITVVDWRVRFNGLSGNQAIICHQGFTNLDGNHWILRWKGDRFAIHGVEGNLTSNWMPEVTTDNLVIDGTIETGVWYHVVFVKIGNIAGIYINGRQRAYKNGLIAVENDVDGTLTIGRTGFQEEGTDSTQTLNGNLDELRIQLSNYFNASPNAQLTDTVIIPGVEYEERSGKVGFFYDKQSGKFRYSRRLTTKMTYDFLNGEIVINKVS